MPELLTAPTLRDAGSAVPRQRVLLLTLTMTSSLGMVASTIYVPSIPAIAGAFETSIARVQLTFVGYLLAFAASMLVLGPLSDRYGRRRTILCGLALSAISSVACAISPSIDFLIAARVVQGIGACAGLVVGRAITREVWGREAAARVIAGRAIAATLMQAFAPILGGYLQGWFGWRCNFVVIGLIASVAMALVTRYVPEGRAATAAPSRTGGMLASYRTLIGTRRFLSYAFTAAGSHAGFHIFAAGAPAVLIVGFGIPPEDYGFYASLPPMGFLVGSFLSNRLTRRLGIDGLITIGCTVLIPAASIMVTLALLGVASPYAVIGPMILICCGSGLITPNATAGSLVVNAGMVGTASGLGSFIQMTGAAGATALLSLGPSGSPLMLASIIALVGLFAATAFGSLIQLDQRPVQAAAAA
ncbi:MAG TPA: multidrug effflux MFS transporter [Stellaceae bacterium]|jgi:DHA1 family bicyclomycin/chloramphenicol resistance-like MFS transporter|nr:multidrug effflux MFS transporter [Stellaceae bacterium]